MPYEDYSKSASVLDNKRLGKQRVETYQILLQLCGLNKFLEPREGKWNHPAMAMWSGHEIALVDYQEAVCQEWTNRGFKDTCLMKSQRALEVCQNDDWTVEKPSWIGDIDVHLSHQSNLLRKDKKFYEKFFNVEDDLEYIWPKNNFDLKTRMKENYLRMLELMKNNFKTSF